MIVRAACRPLPRASGRAPMAWIRPGTRSNHDGYQIRARWRWNRWLANRSTSSSVPLAALMVINIHRSGFSSEKIRVMANPLQGPPEQRSDARDLRENIIHLGRHVSTRVSFGTGAGTADGAIVDRQPRLRHQPGHQVSWRVARVRRAAPATGLLTGLNVIRGLGR